jgi:hypothetical protein
MPSFSPPTSGPSRCTAPTCTVRPAALHDDVPLDVDGALSRLYPASAPTLPPFHRRLLLLTGLTQLADALALMLMPFLASEVACGWLGGDDAGAALLSTALFLGMLVGALGGGYVSDR